ncbi:hypothetical protein Q3G72_022317 [Acer saccharum]|nr:hypothetical protein Q3G72_022317 [Acer saccharum]
MCHMTACSLLSYAAIAFMKVVPMQSIKSKRQFLKISALSVVVLGNVSLRFLPVSFNQAIGATTPFFAAVFAYLMSNKREAWLTYATLVPVVAGVIFASREDLQPTDAILDRNRDSRNFCELSLLLQLVVVGRSANSREKCDQECNPRSHPSLQFSSIKRLRGALL